MDVQFDWERGRDPEVFQETLDNFVDELADELDEAIERLMDDVLETVRKLSPVDTGTLRASYETEVREAMESAMGLVVEGIVETGVEYAPFQEFLETGTAHVAPAIEQHREDLEREAQRAWDNAVRTVS